MRLPGHNSIPAGRPGGYRGPTYGHFVDLGDRVVLFDLMEANDWPADKVSIVQGCFGFDDEGLEKLPRPTKYASDEKTVLIQGDHVVIDFLGGNSSRPIVTGVVRGITATDLARNHADAPTFNRFRLRVTPKDRTTGAATGGYVDVTIAGDDNASISVIASSWAALAAGSITLQVGDWKAVIVDGVMEITGTGDGAEFVLRAEKFLEQLSKVLSELSASNAALGLPITETIVMIAQIALASGPSGYQSKHLKTE